MNISPRKKKKYYEKIEPKLKDLDIYTPTPTSDKLFLGFAKKIAISARDEAFIFNTMKHQWEGDLDEKRANDLLKNKPVEFILDHVGDKHKFFSEASIKHDRLDLFKVLDQITLHNAHQAIIHNKLEFITYMIDKGFDVTQNNDELLYRAVDRNLMDISVKLIVSGANPDNLDSWGNSQAYLHQWKHEYKERVKHYQTIGKPLFLQHQLNKELEEKPVTKKIKI